MGFADVVRSGVAIADSLTADLQDTVTHEAWTGHDVNGKPTYASGVSVQAIVEQGPKSFRKSDGTVVTVKAVLLIPRPISANGASNRIEPIDPRDRFTLPDGSVASPVEKASGVVDPSTSAAYAHTVALG